MLSEKGLRDAILADKLTAAKILLSEVEWGHPALKREWMGKGEVMAQLAMIEAIAQHQYVMQDISKSLEAIANWCNYNFEFAGVIRNGTG